MQKDTIRISIITLVVAVVFGIKEIIPPGKQFDQINIELSLKVFSEVFFQIILVMLIVYLILLSLNYSYSKTSKNRLHEFVYDFTVTITAMTVFLTICLLILLWMVVRFPNFIRPGWFTNIILALLVIASGLFFEKRLEEYFGEFSDSLKEKLNCLFKSK